MMHAENYQVPRSLREDMAFLLRVASERAVEMMDDELLGMGLHSRHAAILALADEHTLNQNMIAEATQTHPNAVITLIDTLEKKGLATREQNPVNRREYLVKLTPAGRKALREVERAARQAISRFTDHLDETEKAQLLRLLLKCIEAWHG